MRSGERPITSRVRAVMLILCTIQYLHILLGACYGLYLIALMLLRYSIALRVQPISHPITIYNSSCAFLVQVAI